MQESKMKCKVIRYLNAFENVSLCSNVISFPSNSQRRPGT